MIKPTFTVDTREFDRVLKQYVDVNLKQSLAEIINTKAFYIARGAARLTPRADYQKMAKELGVKLRAVSSGKRKGKLTMR